MKQVAKKLAKGAELQDHEDDPNTDKKVFVVFAKLEWDMRAALSEAVKQNKSIGHGDLPHPCLAEPVPEEDEETEKAPLVLYPPPLHALAVADRVGCIHPLTRVGSR
jgi:hypothetical protein